MNTHPRHLISVLVLFALLVVLMVAGVATGAPTWQAVPNSIQGTPASAAQDGPRTLIVSNVRRRLILTTLSAGRASARTLVPRLGLGGTRPRQIVLATPGGSAIAVWEDVADAQVQIRVSLRGTPSSGWTAPRTISRYPAAGFGRVFRASVGADGTVLVAWWGGPAGGRLGIYARTWKLGAGWSPAVDVTRGTFPQGNAGSSASVGTAIGPRGDMAVSWQVGPGNDARLSIARRPAGGGWAAPVQVASGYLSGFGGPPVAVDGSGRAVTAWFEYSAPPPGGISERVCLQAAVVGGGATERQEIRCAAGAFNGSVGVAADADGNLAAVWQLTRVTPYVAEVHASARAAGATAWTAPAPLVDASRGYAIPWGIQAIGGAQFQVVTTIATPTSSADSNRVEVATVDAAGAPVGPPLGPPDRPGLPIYTSDVFAPFANAAGGVLAWGKVGPVARSGVAILRP